ncbi:LysR family transcriptional regulator [Actinomadura fulvescens]
MDMDLGSGPTVHQLRLFLILAKERHFGRAAARSFISQPALSRQIQVLEQRLGVAVVERDRTVRLTPAGLALLAKARAVVEAMDDLRQTAQEQGRAARGQLVVGTIGAEAAMPHLRAVLEQARQHNPALEIRTRLLDFVHHFAALENGEVDVVFCRPPMPPHIRTRHLADEARVACLPAADPLAGRASVKLADLGGYPILSLPPECPQAWRDFWAADPRPDGNPVPYGPVVGDIEALMLAVSDGHGMAFLPAAARTLFPRPGVAYVDVIDLPPCTAALAWAERNNDNPNLRAIRRAAETISLPGRRSDRGLSTSP